MATKWLHFYVSTSYLKKHPTLQTYLEMSMNIFIAGHLITEVRILWFNWRDLKNPDAGGAEVFTYEVMTRLTKMGHEITLFCPLFPNAATNEKIDGIEVIRREEYLQFI